jgi:hypothetical protein
MAALTTLRPCATKTQICVLPAAGQPIGLFFSGDLEPSAKLRKVETLRHGQRADQAAAREANLPLSKAVPENMQICIIKIARRRRPEVRSSGKFAT